MSGPKDAKEKLLSQTTVDGPFDMKMIADERAFASIGGMLPLGTVVADRYKITARLGQGSMGQVYKATHLLTGGVSALKVISIVGMNEEKAIGRFELEARNAAALSHPNTVRVTDYGQHEGMPFLVMEFVSGRPLSELVAEKPLPWTRAVPILAQLLRALWAAHTHPLGIIHRDIKPENILIADQHGTPDFVKVLDFGISRARHISNNSTGLVGSPTTMSPEQWEGDPVGPSTDLYAVGCTAFEMLTGEPPFTGVSLVAVCYQHVYKPPPLDRLHGLVPSAIIDWLAELLAKSPLDRPASAAVALRSLEAASGRPLGAPSTEKATAERIRQSWQRNLDPDTGFLPSEIPLTSLPEPFDVFENLCDEIPMRMASGGGGARALLDKALARVDFRHVRDIVDLSGPERARLMTLLCLLRHAYRWDVLPPTPESRALTSLTLPEGLKHVFVDLCELVGQPRTSLLWNMALTNWHLRGRRGGESYAASDLSLDDLVLGSSWVAGEEGEATQNYLMAFVLAEAQGAAIARAVVGAIESAAEEDLQKTLWYLETLRKSIGRLSVLFMRAVRPGRIPVAVWRSQIVSFLGWGLVGDTPGVGPMSGAHLGTFQTLTAVLGLGDDDTLLRSQAARRAMPSNHAEFLRVLDEGRFIVRQFVARSEDERLKACFNDCLSAMRVWRVAHQKQGVPYLGDKARNAPTCLTSGGDEAPDGQSRETFEAVMEAGTARLVKNQVQRAPGGFRPATLDSILRFLSDTERRQLLSVGTSSVFYPPGSVLLEQGHRGHGLMIIREGSVSVEVAGSPVPVARRTTGAVLGEMSFLENAPASATLRAEGEVVLDLISRDALYDLLAHAPGLRSRFYQSLATVMSQRLRGLGALRSDKPSVNAPTISPRHVRLTGLGGEPPEVLREATRAFVRTMSALREDAESAKRPADALFAVVQDACDALASQLSESIAANPEQADVMGALVYREAFPHLMQSATHDRARSRLRGVERGHDTLWPIYAGHPDGDAPLGIHIDRWVLDRPSFESMRACGKAMRDITQTLLRYNRQGPLSVAMFSLGHGGLLPDPGPIVGMSLLCVDLDPQALAFCQNQRPKATGVLANILHAAEGLAHLDLPPLQLILCQGLLDDLDDAQAVGMLDWIHAQLAPGGSVLVGAMTKDNPDRAWMEHILGWTVRHRSPNHIGDLFTRSSFGVSPVEERFRAPGWVLVECIKRS